MTSIRRIRTDEYQIYRAVRLAALQQAPEAFCTTYAEAEVRDDASWMKQVEENAESEDRAIFLAFVVDRAIGLAGIYRSERDMATGELCQVWVAPEHRGTGIADTLMAAVSTWAAERGFSTILATIRAGNDRVIRFYRKCGFTDAYGESGPLPGDVVLARHIGRNESNGAPWT